MTSSTRTIAITIVVVILIAVLGYFVYREHAATEASMAQLNSATSTSLNATSSISTSTSGYTVMTVPITSSGSTLAAPDHTTPLTFSSDFTTAEEVSYQSQFATIQTTLASNPTDWASWINLGMLRKETGDYQGAAVDWLYVTRLYPNDQTAFADLGDLYANFLNEPSEAVGYYKQALAIDPTQENSYVNLTEVYEALGDTTDARATLQQGISLKVVGYQNLQTMLNSVQ